MSVLKLKNTYTQRLEVFQPLDPQGQRTFLQENVASEGSTGMVRASAGSAHSASLYGLMIGVSSVSASLKRPGA